MALKVPHEGLLTEPRVVDRFLDEARALARLRHPRIVPIYEVGCDGACYFFVMALIEGQGLDAVIRSGPPPHRRAARIACDLADALAYAHEHGIVHRDVKPANILIDHQGRANLMDFGLARRQGSVGPGSPDRTGSIVGTPAYLAPSRRTAWPTTSCRPLINTAWASSCMNSSAADHPSSARRRWCSPTRSNASRPARGR